MANLLKPPLPRRKPKPTPAHLLTGKPTKAMTFAEKIYCLTATIPKGHVTSYGSLAAAAGNPLAARAVGTAMRNCPYDDKIPCHRVVASTLALHGFRGEPGRKRKLLEAEGVQISNNKVHRAHYIEL